MWVFIKSGACVELFVVDARAIQSKVLMLNDYGQSPFGGRRFIDFCLALALGHFSHTCFGFMPCPIWKLHDRLHLRLIIDSMQFDVDLSGMTIPRVIKICQLSATALLVYPER